MCVFQTPKLKSKSCWPSRTVGDAVPCSATADDNASAHRLMPSAQGNVLFIHIAFSPCRHQPTTSPTAPPATSGDIDETSRLRCGCLSKGHLRQNLPTTFRVATAHGSVVRNRPRTLLRERTQ